MFSAESIFSCLASRVMLTGHAPLRSSLPPAIASLWISPSGEEA